MKQSGHWSLGSSRGRTTGPPLSEGETRRIRAKELGPASLRAKTDLD